MKSKLQKKTRNPVGWGYIEEALTLKEKNRLLKNPPAGIKIKIEQSPEPLNPTDIKLTKSRLEVPNNLKEYVTTNNNERLLRAVGRSFRDLALLREKNPLGCADAIALPENASQLESILEWAYKDKLAIIIFGGGSSVVGGVNAEGMESFSGIITTDLQKINRVIEVDTTDRIIHAEAGILGPDLDYALKEHSLHVRHMPQSYHHSTLGGWIVTRGAGHNSTVLTKIEDRVQSLSGILANGKRFQTRALPATSVAIDPKSYWAGSEGFLGIIDSVRLRVYPLPKYRGFRGISFKNFETAMKAARAISQSDLYPVQLRLLDSDEYNQTARLSGREATSQSLMILGDESTYDVVENRLALFSQIALDYGGEINNNTSRILREWIRLFFRQPYMRDFLIENSIIVDTFETSIPWSQAEVFYQKIKSITKKTLLQICGTGHVGCRATHVYADGLCLYFSFYGPGKKGSLLSQWQEIKDAASTAIVSSGGTISHHHAMGRDHRPYAEKEFSQVHKLAIDSLKKSLDPQGQMNPGLW